MQSLQATATASVLSSGLSSSPAKASRALDVVRDVDANSSLSPEGRRLLLDLATQLEREKDQGERLRLRLARSAKELEEAKAYSATLKDALAIRAKDFGFLSDNSVEGMRLLNLMQASLAREREGHAATKEEVAALERRLASCKDTLTDVLSTLQASTREIKERNAQLDAWEQVAKRCQEVTGEPLTAALFDKLHYVFEFYVDVSWELGIQGSFHQDTLPQVKAKSVSLLRELKTRLSQAEKLATTLKAEKEDLEVVNADLVEAVANQEDILASTLAMGRTAGVLTGAEGPERLEGPSAPAPVPVAASADAPAASAASAALAAVPVPAPAPVSEPRAREADVDLEGIERLVTENIELREKVQTLQAALDRARRDQQYQEATIERLNSTNGVYKAKLDELVRDNVLLSTEIRKSGVIQSQIADDEEGKRGVVGAGVGVGANAGMAAAAPVAPVVPVAIAGTAAAAAGEDDRDIPAPRRSAVEPFAGQAEGPAAAGAAQLPTGSFDRGSENEDGQVIDYMSLTGSVVNTKREARAQSHAASHATSVGKSGILDLLEEQEAALREDATRQEERALRNSQRVVESSSALPEAVYQAPGTRDAVPEDFFEGPAAAPAGRIDPKRSHDLLLSLSGDDEDGEIVIPAEPAQARGSAGGVGTADAASNDVQEDVRPDAEGQPPAQVRAQTDSAAVRRAREITHRLRALGAQVPDELLLLAQD